MSNIDEDIHKNNFFLLLKNTYTSIYDNSCKNRFIILIPISKSIKLISTLNINIISSHILQNSPYFQDEFVTLNGKCVTIKDQMVITRSGFNENRQCKILFEEKSFRVLCISAPLEGALPPLDDEINSQYEDNTPFWQRSVMEQDNFLVNIVPSLLITNIVTNQMNNSSTHKSLKLLLRQQIDQMLQAASIFEKSYVIVPQFLNHAADKIRSIIDKSYNNIIELAATNSKLAENETLQAEVWIALESIVMAAVGRKIILQLDAFFATKHNKCVAISNQSPLKTLNRQMKTGSISTMEIRNMHSKTITSNSVDKTQKFSLASVGLRNELCGVDVSGAVELMLKLDATNLSDDKLSPMTKFSILKEINDMFYASVDKLASALKITVATDDMLPLWVFTLVHAIACASQRFNTNNALQMHTNISYLTTFHLPPAQAPHMTSEFQYFVANLQASLSYIENTLVTPIDLSSYSSRGHNSSFSFSSKIQLNNLSRSSSFTSYSGQMPQSSPTENSTKKPPSLKDLMLPSQSRRNPDSRSPATVEYGLSSPYGVSSPVASFESSRLSTTASFESGRLSTANSFTDSTLRTDSIKKGIFSVIEEMDDNISGNVNNLFKIV